MSVADLQTFLTQAGADPGPVDNQWGKRTEAALIVAITGTDARLTAADIAEAAKQIFAEPAHIQAVLDVESAGRGLHQVTHLPIILFEPHVFHRLTKGRFADHPDLSYPKWGTRPYPATQADRWGQLVRACALDWSAALQSASWGLFQVMGFNAPAEGLKPTDAEVWRFVRGMTSERGQLLAFVEFLRANKLDVLLRNAQWAGFAAKYNGPSYSQHSYDLKLRAAYLRHAEWHAA